ncbi:MAG: UDP-N-acetylmuramate dehydrogenase [Clostridia bacterium]|nr:UDP-N-acetylmuramate dehydrogenase [Clostridia bacterium]
MSIERLKQYAGELSCVYFENEPMSEHTSFKIGGNADIFIQPPTKTALSNIAQACNRWDVPTLILGNGSNVLVSDNGIRGAVISTTGLSDIKMLDAYTIECGAGVKTSRLCSFALENGLSGFEFLWGIPGTMGGAAFMNAGAYDGEMKDVLVCCNHITPSGEEGCLQGDELGLSYRHSAYSDNGYIITSVVLKGTPKDPDLIREKMDDLMGRRKAKQPLEYPSAGSIFKRPQGHYAAALIEQCGLKGCSVGGAMVSEKHSGFIINTGGATASDVKTLIEKIQNEVFLQTDVQLECEVRMVG